MPLPEPAPGLVVCYEYLWRHEHDRGREEAQKARPCVVVMATRREAEGLVVIVAPITHRLPADRVRAVAIPAATKARLGLNAEQSWVITDEVNRFIWPGADLRPISRQRPSRFDFGMLPPRLFREIRDQIVARARAQQLRVTPRSA